MLASGKRGSKWSSTFNPRTGVKVHGWLYDEMTRRNSLSPTLTTLWAQLLLRKIGEWLLMRAERFDAYSVAKKIQATHTKPHAGITFGFHFREARGSRENKTKGQHNSPKYKSAKFSERGPEKDSQTPQNVTWFLFLSWNSWHFWNLKNFAEKTFCSASACPHLTSSTDKLEWFKKRHLRIPEHHLCALQSHLLRWWS